MTAPTHIAFSTVLYLYICTLFRIPISFADVACACFSSLLPDLDTTVSGVGYRVRLVSNWLEKRFGHRTFTHSAIGVLVFSVIVLPLWIHSWQLYLWAIIGFWSHGFLDLFNRQGIQFFWPYQAWGIFPTKLEHRVRVGSTAEHILLVGLCVLSLVLYPIASVGLNRTIHYMMANVTSAVKDYHDYSSKYELYAEVDGTKRKIDQHISGRYRVLDAKSEYSLLVEIDGKPHIVGTSTDAHIVPKSIRIKKGKEVHHFTQTLDMDGHTLGELQKLQSVDHRLFGTLRMLCDVTLKMPVDHYATIEKVGNTLRLDYATYADIKRLGLQDVTVYASTLLIKITGKRNTTFQRVELTDAGTSVYPITVNIATPQDVKVGEGDQIKRGMILIAHSEKLRQITLIESELETLAQLRQQKSFSYSVQLQEWNRNIVALENEIQRLHTQDSTYEQTVGFEKEQGELERSITKHQFETATLQTKMKRLRAQDRQDRLTYQQTYVEKLSQKEHLQSTVYTKALFDGQVVNVSFTHQNVTLYLRKE